MPTTIARIMATQLIPLPEVERLSSSVIRVLGGNPGKASPLGVEFLWIQNGSHPSDADRCRGSTFWQFISISSSPDNFYFDNPWLFSKAFLAKI
jgi:hypothetical protein